jgi:queuine/archaeosine tRNA-ribosyltransferase
MVQGLNDMRQILEAIELGIDLIATDLPRVLTAMGCAFSRRFGVSEGSSAQLNMDADTSNDINNEPASKRARFDTEISKTQDASDFYINIRDKRYIHDKTPLVSGCMCHACRYVYL